jgi:hypothetical protein
MVFINGIFFEKSPEKYFVKKALSKVYRIKRVSERWYLSLISLIEQKNYKIKGNITTIILSEPPFTELEEFLKEKDIIKFDEIDHDYWQEIVLEYRNFGEYTCPQIFDGYLDMRCMKWV